MKIKHKGDGRPRGYFRGELIDCIGGRVHVTVGADADSHWFEAAVPCDGSCAGWQEDAAPMIYLTLFSASEAYWRKVFEVAPDLEEEVLAIFSEGEGEWP